MLVINKRLALPEEEIRWQAVRSSGAGGQNVNKVASAVQLFFDVRASASLPAGCQARLLKLRDHRLTAEGVLVIKAQEHRTQEKNLQAARERLAALVRAALPAPVKRRPTQPTRASKARRLESKARQARTKSLRGRPPGE
ncbi:MAG: aminoacyl-tRNA hydrolase [Opitutales bacterium]|nr:aminoacyl-tRNA hydrolase [Opitutales bacterium]